MIFPKDSNIINDFNLSVILPFYKKIEEFKCILPQNSLFFQRNGIEVIIVMDEPTEKHEVQILIKDYPMINWVLIVNNSEHSWRNPAKAINVGIRASSKDYVMVCSPESKFQSDAIYYLRYTAEIYDPCFTIGNVFFSSFSNQYSLNTGSPLKYGSILVKKQYIEAVNGYTEFFDNWGGEDDNIRTKLSFSGIRKIYIPEATLVHYEKENDGKSKRHQKSAKNSIQIKKKAAFVSPDDFNNQNWGRDFDNIVYDYRSQSLGYDVCKKYVQGFKNWEISDESIFNKKFKVIALIQTHNEIDNIKGVLKNLDEICDGIILLDDDSVDGTYNEAVSDKILIKIQKNRLGFNDLENRNILLNIISFINSEYAFFIDADERIVIMGDQLIPKDCEAYKAFCFYLVHLWDSDLQFRTDLVEASPIRKPGILHRWRMFKLCGRLQIVSSNKLHFQATPYKTTPKVILPVLILHHGMKSKEIRHRKYDNYMIEDEDKNKTKYAYFLDDNIELQHLDSLNPADFQQNCPPKNY